MYKLFLAAIDHLSAESGNFYSYDEWEKVPDKRDNLYIYNVNRKLEPVGIIIQGPLKREDNFTVETVKYYRKLFPTAVLIVSTWESEDKELLAQMKKAGAHIVLSKLPEIRGVANVNCQVKSTLAGLEYAEKMGLRHVLKTRSDQRIYAWNALRYLLALNKTFPVSPNVKTEERLIIANEFTRRFTPFHFSDFLMFGTVGDLKLYWEQPFSTVNEYIFIRGLADANKETCAEVFLSKNFTKKISPDCKYTVAEYYSILKDYFCIVDLRQLDLYWHWGKKWALGVRFKVQHSSAKYKSEMCLDFADWLHIYQSGEELHLPEEVWKRQKYGEDVLL